MEIRLPESCSCSDHSRVAARVRFAALQHHNLVAPEQGDTGGHRLEVIEEDHALDAEMCADLRRADVPQNVRQARPLIDDWSGDADGGGFNDERLADVAGERVEN